MEMTTIKYIIIFLLYNLLSFVGCCPALSSSIGTITPDPEVEFGTTLLINCSLDSHIVNLKSGPIYVNSSMLLFKFKSGNLTENIYIIDPLTIQLRKENATFEDEGTYFCFLKTEKKKKLVCTSTVTIGYPPLPVEHFSCVSMHFKNLTCSWIPQKNHIRTNFILQNLISVGNNQYFPRKCPEKISDTSCQWTLSSNPPYRRIGKTKTFRLIGTNSLGNNSELFTINHFERVLPSAPEQINVTDITKNRFVVNWTAPYEMQFENFEQGLIYEMQYKSEYNDSWNAHEHQNHTDPIEVTDLNPFTSYDVRVRCRLRQAKTDDMWSNFTTAVVQTDEDIPYVTPSVVQGLFEIRNLQGQEFRNITIHWKPVPKKDWNGRNFHYLISYTEFHIPIIRLRRELTNFIGRSVEGKFSTTFTHMNSKSDYIFHIKTANSYGISEKSSEIKVNRKENLLPVPKDIKVIDHGQGMYQLSWSMPKDTKVQVDNYTVFWCEAIKSRPFPCHGSFQWTVVSKDYSSIRLNLSDVDTNYHFAISANSELSSSGLEWAPCVLPYYGVLNKIEKVILQSINSTSIKIIWYLDCVAQRHFIKEYRIYYCESYDYEFNCKGSIKTITLTDPQAPNYVISGLKPYTRYGIAIATVTIGGLSEPSDYRIERTKAGAPSDPPQNVSIINKTDTTIEITLDPPSIRNGIITKYDIRIIAENGNTKQKTVSAPFHEQKFSTIIEQLTPYTNYTIEIEACVDHDCSPPSIIHLMTDIGVPGVMDPPIPEVYNATFVQVSWLPPLNRNGPINFYTLYIQWEDNNELQNQSINISNHTHYNMSVVCPFIDKDMLYSFSVQAANIKNGDVLYGDQSSQTQTKLCYISTDGFSLSLLLGIIVGGVFGLAVLIFVFYAFARWMKRKVDRINEFKVQLPPGLESPHCNSLNSYENFKNGLIRKASESNLSPQTLYGRLSSYASDEGDPKDPPDSDASQFSNNSTEELLYKKNGQSNHGGFHSSGDSNTGKGHDSISSSLTNRTQLSSDSGAETDVLPPPSPESDNGQGLPHSSPQPQNKSILPKVDEAHSSDSKDSGLEKEEGGNEKESNSNHYSKFVCYLDNPEHPYNQRKILDRSSGNQQLPYSKFGVNMPGVSGYIPLANSLVFMSRTLANSEPSVMDMDKINEKDQEITTDVVTSPYSKYGLARSFGEALNMPAAADISELNNGYSKCGIASNMPCLQNEKKPYIANNVTSSVSETKPSTQDVQLPKQSKIPELIEKTLPLSPAWTPSPKSNGYVTVDKLINPNKIQPVQPADDTAYSRLGTKPEMINPPCQSKGYVSVQDAKDMLSGKEKINQVESKEHPMGIPGYSKFDIQCDRLVNTPNTETMDPLLTGTKPKIYPHNVRQDYVPYCGFNDTNDDYMCNKSPNLEINGQNSNNSTIFPMEENIGNIESNLSPAKYLAHPKTHEPKNGYVQISTELSPDAIKIVPSDAQIHPSLTDTAV